MKDGKIITRMAPSPTGNFHIGGVRTALYNYLFARQNGGVFILRSEDTDKERSKREYEDQIFEIFKWLELDYDQFFRQSDRIDIYVSAVQKMISSGHAYEAEDSTDSPGKKVIRFKNPNTKITFTDLLLGDITFDTSDLGDFVIARDIESPLYHLTVVIDDGEMGVTHVIRGQEHTSNTPRQILLLEALGYDRPLYLHLPLIMSPRGGKLSKRDPEVVPVMDYKKSGFLPDALLNFLALIGWNPGGEKEIFSKGELMSAFSLERVQKTNGIFNVDKLNFINKEHIKLMTFDEQLKYLEEGLSPALVEGLKGRGLFEKVAPLVLERIHNLDEVRQMETDGEFGYFVEAPEIKKEMLVWKEDGIEKAKDALAKAITAIENFDDDKFASSDELKTELMPTAEEFGRGSFLWPLRVSLSGREKSPDPFTLLSLLGKTESLKRIQGILSVL